MTDTNHPTEPRRIESSLVEVPEGEIGTLVALALTLTEASAARASASHEAFQIIGERLRMYFRENGIVLMRPPSEETSADHPKAGRSDALPEG